MSGLSAGERYALGFFTGAGLWHLGLLCIGLAGGYSYGIAVAVTLTVLFPSMLVLAHRSALGPIVDLDLSSSNRTGKAALLALLVCVAALFVAVKGLHPAGGHDYYTHYFSYYVSVLRNGSILPNEVWYHFYYSKGAGLYFLTMLLTDPLAPQLVATAFIGAGAVTVAALLQRAMPGTLFPWLGSLLYVGFLIFTPGPPENMRHGGWGDLEKIHELSAVMLLGVFWISSRESTTAHRERKIWLVAWACAIVAAVLLTALLALIIGAFFTVLMAWGACTRNRALIGSSFFGAAVAGISILAILAVNYALTGIPLDQAIVYLWPITDLEKVNRWGVLTEVLINHIALWGLSQQMAPLNWQLAAHIATYLRLDILWPVAAVGLVASVWGCFSGRWRGLLGSPAFTAPLRNGLIFAAIIVVLAAAPGPRSQVISFYRFSSFTYGPVLCTLLLLWAPLPVGTGARLIAAGVAVAAAVGVWMLALSPFGTSVFPQRVTVYENIPAYAAQVHRQKKTALHEVGRFLGGQFSLQEAYQNQRGWPGRLPWGGIYPAMEKVWQIAGRDTPIYSLHVHSYCMLPNCNVLYWSTHRIAPNLEVVLFGEPQQAVTALKRAGINFFFVSKELSTPGLGIRTPMVLSPVLAPETIAQHLGIRWTDGNSYLLTWLEDGIRPLDQEFLDGYGKTIRDSGIAASFPTESWKMLFARFREMGLRPYRLPWCPSCPGLSPD